MPQWIDTQAHGIALLARNAVDGKKELVLRRLRPEAEIPAAAIDYGFEPEGDIYVRRETKFNLVEIRRFFPEAKVAEMALEDIVFRSIAPVVPIERVLSSLPSVVAQDMLMEEAQLTTSQWALVPRPRFFAEAMAQVENGKLWIEQGGLRFATDRRNPDTAKAEAHRAAVTEAMNRGDQLPFAVLVDYPELAYFGTRKSHASTRIAKLLSGLAITEKLMTGETGYARLENDPYMDLVIERLPYPDGDRLILTHYRDQGGDRILDAEMVFGIRGGRLYLKETAVENVLRGGEIRSYDAYFANRFSANLLDQGFAQATVVWPFDKRPVPERSPMVEPEVDSEGAQVLQMNRGPLSGMSMALVLDWEGAAKLSMGMTPATAAAAIAEQGESHTVPRQLPVGLNMFGMTILEDEHGLRRIIFGENPHTEVAGDRGLEFLTQDEAKRSGQLSLVKGTPIEGAKLFGRPLFRSLSEHDGQVAHFAIEQRGDGNTFAYRLQIQPDVAPYWDSLGAPWPHGKPTDSELRSPVVRTSPSVFDSHALIRELNTAIEETNADIDEPRLMLHRLDPEKVSITQIDTLAYELRPVDSWLPLAPVLIEADGDMWRASEGSSRSLRNSFEAAFSWAYASIASRREHFLAHLHRSTDGNLKFAIPLADFEVLRHVLHKVSIGEQTRWDDLGITLSIQTEISRFEMAREGDSRIRVAIKDSALAYEVFALEADPASAFKAYETQALGRISAWLHQVDKDVAWEQTVTCHPSGALISEWIQTYQDLQIKHYGEERFGTRVPSDWARELVLALADRKVDQLLKVIADNGTTNKSSVKLFQQATGLSVGSNRASREAAVYSYCGFDAASAAEHKAQKQGFAKVRSLEAEARRTIARAESTNVQHNGVIKTAKAFIDELFAQGYTQLSASKRGAATRYGLVHPGTRSYYKLKEPMTGYVRHLIAIHESAKAPVDEMEDRLVPRL